MESMTEDSIEARRWLARKNFIEALRQLILLRSHFSDFLIMAQFYPYLNNGSNN